MPNDRSSVRGGMAPALALLILAAGGPQLIAQTDNFNDGNDTSPIAWTEYSPVYAIYTYAKGTWSFPPDGNGGYAYRMTVPGYTSDPLGFQNPRACAIPMAYTYTNRFYIAADLLAWATNGRPNAGFVWYVSDFALGTTKGYAATYSHKYGNIYISMVYNEAQSYYFSRIDDYQQTLNATNRYRMVASSHDGTTFVFTLYNLQEPNTPWCSAIGADSTYQGIPGFSGLLVMNEDLLTTNGAGATFDNYTAYTPASLPATVTDVYPPPAGLSRAAYVFVTNSVVILNRDTTVDTSSIKFSLDGAWISSDALTIEGSVYRQYNPGAYQQNFDGATVRYSIPNLLVPGTKHTNVIVYADSASTRYTNTWTWTVGSYPYFFASNSLPVGSLSVRGFDARMAQTTNNGTALDNSLARALQQLAGKVAVDQRATSIVQVLNWNKASEYPYNVPGLCAGDAINIAVKSCAYLHLKAGINRFHIITDDRSGFYSGTTFAETSTYSTATWEASNSTADSYFDVVVEAEGLYPVSLLWEETGGTGKLALYSVDPNDGTEVLINDENDPAGVVKAWYPVVCMSSSTLTGTYTVASAAANVLKIVDNTSASCGSVVSRTVTGGTITVPISGTQQFYKVLTAEKATVTSVTKGTSNLVITYEFK